MKNFKGPLFIVGMPRSGTKLLRGLLNNHSQIAIPNYETEFLPYWNKHWHEYGNLGDFGVFREFYETTKKSSFFYFMERHHGKSVSAEKWHQACKGDWSVASVFEALIRCDTECTDDMIWGDKSPSYIGHIPLLLKLFPDGKIIHIVRDVRDYSLSINKAWGKNILRAAQRWADDVRNAKASLAIFPDRSIEVRFEDLLSDPKRLLQTICNFVEINFENKMLLLSKPTENIGDAKGATTIVAGNKEKWQNKLEEATLRRIEQICRDTLLAYNYQVSYQGSVRRVSEIQLAYLKVLDGINLIFHETGKRGVVNNILFHLRYAKHSGNSQQPMSTSNSNAILVTVPSLLDKGGVASFYNGVSPHFPQGQVIPLEIGGSKKFGGLLHPLIDQIRFRRTVKKLKPVLIHLNPSLITKSFFRDGLFAWQAKKMGYPLLIFWHGWGEKFASDVEKKYFAFFNKTFGLADGFIVLASEFERKLREWG